MVKNIKMSIKIKIVFALMMILFVVVMPAIAASNGSIVPSAQRGGASLPKAATDGINGIVDLAMYVVAILAILAAIFAAGMAFLSKDPKKKNEGLTWLGYIVAISLILWVVFAIINAFLFT